MNIFADKSLRVFLLIFLSKIHRGIIIWWKVVNILKAFFTITLLPGGVFLCWSRWKEKNPFPKVNALSWNHCQGMLDILLDAVDYLEHAFHTFSSIIDCKLFEFRKAFSTLTFYLKAELTVLRGIWNNWKVSGTQFQKNWIYVPTLPMTAQT